MHQLRYSAILPVAHVVLTGRRVSCTYTRLEWTVGCFVVYSEVGRMSLVRRVAEHDGMVSFRPIMAANL
jgi:hypothetical protein